MKRCFIFQQPGQQPAFIIIGLNLWGRPKYFCNLLFVVIIYCQTPTQSVLKARRKDESTWKGKDCTCIEMCNLWISTSLNTCTHVNHGNVLTQQKNQWWKNENHFLLPSQLKRPQHWNLSLVEQPDICPSASELDVWLACEPDPGTVPRGAYSSTSRNKHMESSECN